MNESFVFYSTFYEAIKLLPRRQQPEAYAVLMEYALYGHLPAEEASPVARAILQVAMPNIDAARERYRRNVENGKQGGRPKKDRQTVDNEAETKPAKTRKNPTVTRKNPTAENENLNVDEDVDDDEDEKETIKREGEETLKAAPAVAPRSKMETRLLTFQKELAGYADHYDASVLNAFALYWTEPNPSHTKMRFEMERTWDLKRRLQTWNNRETQYQNRYATTQQQKQTALDQQRQHLSETIQRLDREAAAVDGRASLPYGAENEGALPATLTIA